MMNSNGRFRSHLMQQFAAVARNQSRPPIALARASLTLTRKDPFICTPKEPTLQQLFEGRSFISSSTGILQSDNDNHESFKESVVPSQEEVVPRTTLKSEERHGANEKTDWSSNPRTSTKHYISSFLQLNPDLRPALDRAIFFAQSATNHGRFTENCSFRRLLSQAAIDSLSTIAYHISFQRRFLKDPDGAIAFAEGKKRKWSQIPAFLVALVGNQPETENTDVNPYDELPFVPLVTPQHLEDYAASYAALHHVLSWLDTERIGTKLTTGPILRTMAFRQLIGAKATDRIVAMIMVGYTERTTQAHAFPRPALLQDL